MAVPLYALVPAAGRGERFGGPKLLTRWNNRELLGHVLAALAAAQREGVLTETIVVHRADDPAVARLALQYQATPLPTDAAEASLSGTLRTGLAGIAGRASARGGTRAEREARSAILVCLGDQPMIRGEVIDALAREWQAGSAAVRPVYLEAPGVPGHPLLLDQSLWPLVADLRGDEGFGPALERRGIRIRTIRVAGHNPDIDTADDLHALGSSGLGRSS